MGYILVHDPSFYFALHLLDKYQLSGNVITGINKVRSGYKLYVNNKEGEKYSYRKIRRIENGELRNNAYLIDIILRLVGQGGSNVVISDGCCYPYWTTFRSDARKEINKIEYDPVIFARLFMELGDVDDELSKIEIQHNIDLGCLSSLISKLWN